MPITTINPATGEINQIFTEMNETEIDKIIHATHQTFLEWRNTDLIDRAKLLLKLAALLKANKKENALLIAKEMGKPITQGEAEIEKCAFACEHYAKNSADYLKSTAIKTEMSKNTVYYQPLGVIFAIMPWNFPFWQVFRFVAPNIMAGNGILLKHAPICTESSISIEKMFIEAGFPPHLFSALIMTEESARQVINHPKVAGVTLTGSQRAGKIVGSLASAALKKSVLELGGSDPYLILEDADLQLATNACLQSRLNNSGQVCIAAKRLIVTSSIKDKFLALILEKMNDYQMGDPTDRHCKFGPLARKDLRDKVHEQVQQSITKGATLISGGVLPDGPGFYYPPTLLSEVKKGMPAFDEEIFGPVLSIIEAKNEEEAINLANDTPFGLAAAVFTRDVTRGEKIALERIEVGICAVNTFVTSDPRLPFGGIKGSGYGRELAIEGIHSFVNIKTINIK